MAMRSATRSSLIISSSESPSTYSAWLPGVTAPWAMCSRARLRSVWISERKAPLAIAFLSLLAAALRGALLVGCGVLRLDVGLGPVVPGLGFLLAGALFLAFRGVALLLRDFVLVLGLGFCDLALVRRARVVLGLKLGLGDLLLALRVGFADFLLVGLHRAALRLGGFVLGLDLVFLGVARLAVDLRFRVGGAVGACAWGGGLGLGDAGKGERHGCGDGQ